MKVNCISSAALSAALRNREARSREIKHPSTAAERLALALVLAVLALAVLKEVLG